MATNNVVPSDPSQPQELVSSQPKQDTKPDVVACYDPSKGDNPLSSFHIFPGKTCPAGWKEVPGNPSVSDIPIVGQIGDAAQAVNSFFGLLLKASTWKGIFLFAVAGVLLIVGAQFFKGARDIEGKTGKTAAVGAMT